MKNIAIFGAPGAGKGTQSDFLVNEYTLNHISTGDLLRREMALGTPLGLQIKDTMDSGHLVGDDIVEAMIEKAIASDTQGMLFDGFPRNTAQAEVLDRLMAKYHRTLDAVVCLEVPEDELVRRMLERAKVSGRSDDNEATIKNRLQEYHHSTAPVADYYRSRGKLITVNGLGDIATIAADIKNAIDSL